MFPNGNVGLENSKFYEDVPARGHLIGRADKGFFVIFRLYGPKQAFYDQTWKLPDIEKVK